MTNLEPLKSGYHVWHYVPSIAAAITFLTLFSAVPSYLFWKLFKTKIRFIMPFAIGGLFELIGYTARTGASNNTGKLRPYIIQSIFVLLAPTLFAAAVYIVLARIIRVVSGEEYSPIRINLITKIFVYCDIVTFFVQGGGAGFMAERSLSNIGQYIILTGLVLQVVTFVIFVITAVTFARRIGTTPAPATIQGDVPWKMYLRSLYNVSAMILIRYIFRVIEYGLGNNGYLLGHE